MCEYFKFNQLALKKLGYFRCAFVEWIVYVVDKIVELKVRIAHIY